MSSTLALFELTSNMPTDCLVSTPRSDESTSISFSRSIISNASTIGEREAPIERASQDGAVRASAAGLIIAQLTVVTAMASMTNGLVTISIPRMARDLDMPQHLMNWPVLVYSLTCGACLLVAGAAADVIGSRPINLLGSLLLGIFTLASGFAHTGIELIMFRALQGLAAALFLPTSIGVVSQALPSGRMRNIGFSCLGLSQVLGFMFGLVFGGVYLETVGWRVGYYVCAAITFFFTVVGWFTLPKTGSKESTWILVTRVREEIDWVGAALISCSLGMLAYVLAMITTSTEYIRQPYVIVLLTVSLLLLPTFVYWVGRQEGHGKPALIPNSLWRNVPFTSVCAMVLLSFGVMQVFELLTSLYFQEVQQLSALESSLRFLPCLIVGAFLNLTTGLIIHRVPAASLLIITSALSAVSPLLMAVIDKSWPFWYDAFVAQLFQPMSVDVLFTVGLLILSETFPARTQALAGAVFNTISQFGQALGLAIISVISSTVTRRAQAAERLDEASPSALLEDYHAGFWTSFAWMVIVCCIGCFGLRKVGRVGLKRD